MSSIKNKISILIWTFIVAGTFFGYSFLHMYATGLSPRVTRAYQCFMDNGKVHAASFFDSNYSEFRWAMSKMLKEAKPGETFEASQYFEGQWSKICPVVLNDNKLSDFAAAQLGVNTNEVSLGRVKDVDNGFGIMLLFEDKQLEFYGMKNLGMKLVQGKCVKREDNPQIEIISMVERNSAKGYEHEETKGIFLTTKND